MYRRRAAPSINLPDRIVAGVLSLALVALSVVALAPSIGGSDGSDDPSGGVLDGAPDRFRIGGAGGGEEDVPLGAVPPAQGAYAGSRPGTNAPATARVR